MPGISQGLRKLTRILNERSIPCMLIGGHALPAYGRIRATQDIDIAIGAKYTESIGFQAHLSKLGYQLSSRPQPEAPLFFVTDLKNKLEIEIWTKPDGVVFNKELLRRRIKVRPFDDEFEMFVIGPEDFIVNKLARKDRGVQDEQDVISVLSLQKGKLDYAYLNRRAKVAGVAGILMTIIEASDTARK